MWWFQEIYFFTSRRAIASQLEQRSLILRQEGLALLLEHLMTSALVDKGATAGSSGNMTATVQVDTGAVSNALNVSTTGSANLNGDTYNLAISTGWIDGANNTDGSVFDPSTDLLDEVQLISPTVDTNDGTSLATLTGSTLGNSANLQLKIYGDLFWDRYNVF